MKVSGRHALSALAVILAVGGVLWALLSGGDAPAYGSVRAYMQHVYSLQQDVAARLRAGSTDAAQVRELARAAMDLPAVFASDPWIRHPRYDELAEQFIRSGKELEAGWQAGTDSARRSWAEFIGACNGCHYQLGGGPPITP